MKKQYWIYLVIFLACVASRIWSAVYLPEDMETALYTHHVDHLYNQWKELFFSPVYINEIKLLSLLTASRLSYALAGGLATFIIIYASIRLADEPVFRWKGILLSLLIFFNPLLWLYGNRYTPDLTGAAVAMLIMALGLRCRNKRDLYLFWMAVGLLPFIKWIYVLLVLPVIVFMCLQGKEKVKPVWSTVVVLGLIFGVMVFMSGHEVSPLVPEHMTDDLWLSGLQNYQQNVLGIDTMSKALLCFKTLWANAGGGWWSDRPLWLIMPSLVVIFPVIYFLYNKTFFNSSIKEYIILVAGLVYAGVVFIFREVATMQSDLLPLIPLFLIMSVLGLQNLLDAFKTKIIYALVALGLVLYAFNTFHLVREHKEGVAIQQLLSDVAKNRNSPLLASDELFFFVSDYADVRIVSTSTHLDKLSSLHYAGDKKLPEYISKNYTVAPVKVYTHNAYVNPVWTSLTLYKLEKRK